MIEKLQNLRIGELLLDQGLITSAQLEEALEKQVESNKKLGEILIDSGSVSEKALLEILSTQLDLPIIELEDYDYDEAIARHLPESYARRFNAILLRDDEIEALVGLLDPVDMLAVDEISRVLDKELRLALVKRAPLQAALDLLYRRTEDISEFAEQLGQELSAGEETDLSTLTAEHERDAPVVHLLRSIFEDAVQVRASDIHIEPDENLVRIRLRIDGVLHEQRLENAHITAALSQRLKLMSGLNIAEKRLPQDGRFRAKIRGQIIDVRLSTMPIQYGESVVMRLLNQSTGLLSLRTCGMPSDMIPSFRELIHKPNGLVLITGPTGSGKTTTLYAALSELNTTGVKIITIEDPVEYRLSGLNQIQVAPKIGLDFARVLRSALRQDPDIMLVGEMRDQETAEIAIRSALTGHLVLSTLHTNDAASAATRLLDMGVEGYLVAATLRGIVAQRLVRIICEGCKEKMSLSENDKAWLHALYPDEKIDPTYYAGLGCLRCNRSGYKGRIGVFELLKLNEIALEALRRQDKAAFAFAIQGSAPHKKLLENALILAKSGITTLSEVRRTVGDSS